MSEAAQEPSMEEILASIRRIISEDDDNGSAANSGNVEANVSHEPDQDYDPDFDEGTDEDTSGDVVELTERAEPEPVVFDESEPVYEPDPEPEPVMEAAPVVAEPEPEPTYAAVSEPTVPDNEPEPSLSAEAVSEEVEEELLSPHTESQLAGLMGQLDRQPTATPANPGAGKSVEDLTRELLRPMLQAWLDENLPPLVERIVEREIQRVTRRR